MQPVESYIYPAVFNYASDGISIMFPDLPGCFSCADTTNEALYSAREALGLHLFNMEQDNDEIPVPTDIRKIKPEKNQTVILVDVFMPAVRDAINNKAINKTVTLPQWLISAAKAQRINFSQTLQDALLQKLGITREIKHRRYKNQSR